MTEPKLVVMGNGKLGPHIAHTDLPAGPSCPGASSWCELHCYVKHGRFMMPTIQSKYATSFDMLQNDPDAYEAQLVDEVSRLKVGSVFRWHTSGDVSSLEHFRLIVRVCETRPDVTFYLYTRSHTQPWGRTMLAEGRKVPNLHLAASTDSSMTRAPKGWREARVFDDASAARAAGFGAVCPEQTGARPNCETCGLCWRAKPDARLAFVAH